MTNTYIKRSMEGTLLQASEEFPAVILTGPRQSGKTTLLKHLLADTHDYVSLEPPDVRAAALSDPRGFLAMHPAPAVFDEIQYAPDLLAYVKESIDTDRSAKGQFVLTGSQNLLVSEKVSETLAGRAALLTLLPLSWREIAGRPDSALFWERDGGAEDPLAEGVGELWNGILRGGYPELNAERNRSAEAWHGAYVGTYLERDVRSVRQVQDLSVFQSFLRLLAARSAQLLDLSALARDLGVAVNTVRAWLSVLEATYQIVTLRPYFANVRKRLTKSPKVYFTDTGTLCYLVGLRDPEHAANGPMGGALFETAVISEVHRTLLNRGEVPRLHFWRTATGREIDLLVETSDGLVPLEIKASATPRPEMAAQIVSLRAELGDRMADGFVVHTGDTMLPLVEGVRALPFGQL